MKFSTRTFIVLLTLVALVEVATFGAVLNTTRSNFIEQGGRELSLGRLVFDNAIETNSTPVANGVRVLARDFGFRSAVASGDGPTIQSTLTSHVGRIRADVALFVSRDGNVLASTRAIGGIAEGDQFAYSELLNGSRSQNSTMQGIYAEEDTALQLVVEPVFAPDLKGWAAFGFYIDDELASQLHRLTNLQISFASRNGDSLNLIASTLPIEWRSDVLDAFSKATAAPSIVTTNAGKALVLRKPFLNGEDSGLQVLLSFPLDEILAAYTELRTQLLIILAVAFGLAIIGARILARTVAQPLRRFANSARKISEGHYDETFDIQSDDELGSLSEAFNEMQGGIRKRQSQIEFQARHDVLTGLPNRNMISEKIHGSIDVFTSTGIPFALLMLDIRGFKAINDTLGHTIGDDLLKEVSKALLVACRECDTVARHGSDEFLVLIEGADERSALRTARRIVDEIGESVPVHGMEIRAGVNIGLAWYPDHGTVGEELVRRVEIAMYAAKDENATINSYVEGQDEEHLRRLTLVGDLRRALEQDQLTLNFQPKLDLVSGRVCGAEALVRWMHDEHGFISPEEFIPLAERAGLIRKITHTVLDKGFRELKRWREQSIDISLCVNLSAYDLLDESLPDHVQSLMFQNGIDAGSLVFEITESAIMQDVSRALSVIQRIRGIGIRLSIDDFGTGHSSLAQLKRLPFDELKIDKSFVFGILTSDDDAAIVKSTIELAHFMGLKVTAEGVESENIQRSLTQMGCDIAQGYHLSKPLPAHEFLQWMAAHPGTIFGEQDASNDDTSELQTTA